MTTVLVTGGTGTVGKAIVLRLVMAGCKVVATTRHLSSSQTAQADSANPKYLVWRTDHPSALTDLSYIVQSENVSVVIHCAGMALSSTAYHDPFACFDTNYRGALSVLEVARHGLNKIERVILMSTTRSGDLDKQVSPYMASKRASDLMAEAYRASYSVPVVLAHLSAVYGPGERSETRLMPTLMDSVRLCVPPALNTPHSSVNFIHESDVAEAVLALLSSSSPAAHADVGSESSYCIGDLAEFIWRKATGQNPLWPSPIGKDSSEHWPSGWEPKISLRVGVEDLIAQALGRREPTMSKDKL